MCTMSFVQATILVLYLGQKCKNYPSLKFDDKYYSKYYEFLKKMFESDVAFTIKHNECHFTYSGIGIPGDVHAEIGHLRADTGQLAKIIDGCRDVGVVVTL
jgi:hypothetical protein